MSRALKLKNNDYLDSSGIVHNKQKLSDILNNLIPIFSTNGNWGIIKVGKLCICTLNGKNLTYSNGGACDVLLPVTFKDTITVSATANAVWNNVKGYVTCFMVNNKTVRLNLISDSNINYNGTNMTSITVVGQLS